MSKLIAVLELEFVGKSLWLKVRAENGDLSYSLMGRGGVSNAMSNIRLDVPGPYWEAKNPKATIDAVIKWATSGGATVRKVDICPNAGKL